MIFVILIFMTLAALIWLGVIIAAIIAKIKISNTKECYREEYGILRKNVDENENRPTEDIAKLVALRRITARAALLLGISTIFLIPIGLSHGPSSDNTPGQIILFAASLLGLTAIYLAGLNVILAVKVKIHNQSRSRINRTTT